MPWDLDKNGVTPDRDLTNTEQDHLNEFMNRVRNEGIHPKEACESWDSNYESLGGGLYSIRLSQDGRATFMVDDGGQMVTMQSVGGHY
jgi:hypothetical protein